MLQIGVTNVLQELEEDDAFECNELQHWLSIADSRFYGLVEAENGRNRYTSSESGKDSDPNMCKV